MRHAILALTVLGLVGCQTPIQPTPDGPIGAVALAKPVKGGKPSGGPLSLSPSAWTTLSAPSNYPLLNDGGALAFDVRLAPDTMNYLYHTNPPSNITGTVVVSLQVVTTGTPIFGCYPAPWTCNPPATVRPLIMSGSDPFNVNNPLARWWSNPTAFVLANGTITLSIPLTPDRWSSADGRFGNQDATTLAGFAQAISHVSALGVTFGGNGFFGHGVNLTGGGTARFRIVSYQIQ